MFWFRDWNLPIETSLECLGHASEASLRGRRRPTKSACRRAPEHRGRAAHSPRPTHRASAHNSTVPRLSHTRKKTVAKGLRWPREHLS